MLDHCYPPEHLVFMLDTQYLIIGHTKTDEKAALQEQVLVGKATVELPFHSKPLLLLSGFVV